MSQDETTWPCGTDGDPKRPLDPGSGEGDERSDEFYAGRIKTAHTTRLLVFHDLWFSMIFFFGVNVLYHAPS